MKQLGSILLLSTVILTNAFANKAVVNCPPASDFSHVENYSWIFNDKLPAGWEGPTFWMLSPDSYHPDSYGYKETTKEDFEQRFSYYLNNLKLEKLREPNPNVIASNLSAYGFTAGNMVMLCKYELDPNVWDTYTPIFEIKRMLNIPSNASLSCSGVFGGEKGWCQYEQ